MSRRRAVYVQKQLNTSSNPPPSSPPSSSANFPANSLSPDVACRSSDGGLLLHTGGLMQSSRKTSISGTPSQFDGMLASDHQCKHDYEKHLPFAMGNLKLMHDSVGTDSLGQSQSYISNYRKDFASAESRFASKGNAFDVMGTQRDQTQYAEKGNSNLACLSSSGVFDLASVSESSPGCNYTKGSNCGESSQGKMDMNERSEDSGFRYDICPQRSGSIVRLKSPLYVKNREKRNETKRNIGGLCITRLRPGMVLLKQYISFDDQVKLIKKCRDLGLGPGGFYQPGYHDGATLNLKMMCLGKNWDPETSTYGDERPCDGSKPPIVPVEFCNLVKRSIEDNHAHLEKCNRKRNVEDVLPSMSPNICIVNFYTKSGRLGLHQDKDESRESLRRGLPVVSFSIGDSAEFLYGDQRDIDRVEKIKLESGDVLIFGGKSRNIFHGVSTIFPDTAPKALLEETNLRSGRLNLTFREY
ncbi:hypothetical protein ACH5RR_007880 [Cinchona calisaya]|uniref:DNA N(6)-methyladenine demethylase n=1 Tax=Cinchona calisaya TaxID=153742 RepID=A0ABD3AFV9_9GENT